jgi:hypothetical protein
MSKLRVGLVALIALVCAAVQAAPNMLVNLTAEDFVSAGLNNGNPIASWTNHGDLGGNFMPAGNGQGTVFHTSVGPAGVPAVTFTQTGVDAVLTNFVGTAALTPLTGNKPWAFELWVYKDQIHSGGEVVFAWTAREQWPNGNATQSCMEFRYGSDQNNALEHYGDNLGWGGPVPTVQQWHHVAVTRDASGTEKLVLDGELRYTRSLPNLRLRDDVGFFTLGSVQNKNNGNWDMGFRGSVARLRIYDGALSTGDILANYEADCPDFGLIPNPPNVNIWNGTPGSWLPWGTPGNWIGGLPANGNSVYIDNGGKATNYNATLTFDDFQGYNGGLHIAGGTLTALDARDRLTVFGSGTGNAFEFLLEGGTFDVRLDTRNDRDLYIGSGGGYGKAVIGGGAGDAVLCVARDMVVGNGNGGRGEMTILPKGLVTVSNGWFYVVANGAATGTVTVAGGRLLALRNNWLNVSQGPGAQGKLVINSGTAEGWEVLQMSSNNPNQDNLAEVFLNGGTLEIRKIDADTRGMNYFYFNGGRLLNRDGRGNFMQNLDGAYVQAGGPTSMSSRTRRSR